MTAIDSTCNASACPVAEASPCGCKSHAATKVLGSSEAPESTTPRATARKAGSSAALLGSGLAVGACAVCCVVPLAVPSVAIALGGGVLAWFEHAQVWFTLVAVLLVLGSWAWVGWQSWQRRAPPAKLTLVGMGAATALLGVALFWSRLEPLLVECLQR